ncbi:RNA methyltransferase [Marinifilum sp. D714]|nr:RNA methyltransferase [Marinifilum sp. D714]MDQ2178222.1 RNA methyltransferase [Marinifilum sp. D714]
MDLLQTNIKVAYLVHTSDWKNAITTEHLNQIENRIETDEKLMKKVSSLKTPSPVLAVFRIPAWDIDENTIKNSLSILLDDVQDPGNLGTIMRIADWFGIKNIFCSQNTVDVYNPKVIQASMGAIARVKVTYTSLVDLISKYHTKDFPVYGTFLEGETIYKCELQSKGFIVMGNEGQGISEEIGQLVSDKLFIPNFPADQETSESLNVSVATAIICSEFRRVEF